LATPSRLVPKMSEMHPWSFEIDSAGPSTPEMHPWSFEIDSAGPSTRRLLLRHPGKSWLWTNCLSSTRLRLAAAPPSRPSNVIAQNGPKNAACPKTISFKCCTRSYQATTRPSPHSPSTFETRLWNKSRHAPAQRSRWACWRACLVPHTTRLCTALQWACLKRSTRA
jgi:hypothetical protein